MSKIYTVNEIRNSLESTFGKSIYDIGWIGRKGKIENTDHYDFLVGIYHANHVRLVEELFKDAVNIEIRKSGRAFAL